LLQTPGPHALAAAVEVQDADLGGAAINECEQVSGQRVQDSLAYISPGILAHIFDIFFRASVSLDRSFGGLGIGLWMMHSLVALRGGKCTPIATGTAKVRRLRSGFL
jgi:K+-sensing histidine kinase KdpD